MPRCIDSASFDGAVWGQRRHRTGLVLGYIDGYENYHELVDHFRGTQVKVASITVEAHPGAKIIDVEAGASSVATAVGWCIAKLRQGKRPTVYGGGDDLDAVYRGLQAHHYHGPLASYWLAFYVQVAPAPAQVDWFRRLPRGRSGWQFADSVATPDGHSYDCSVVSSSWVRLQGLS